MRKVLLLLALLWPVTVFAQPAALVGTTVRTTSTAATSVRVGCTQSGTCTGGIIAGPIDVASVTSSGFIGIANNVPGVTTFRLYNDAGTLKWNGTTVAIGGSISGTTSTIGKFTAPNAIGDSIMTESGTTITVASTLNATTLGGTLSTVSQPNVTTMAGLVSIGTITTGVWSGTIVGLSKGGTGADLSGTGGTSQFLRQNTVGGTVTVVRPAVSDLSDGSNVVLLNATNNFTSTGGILTSASGGTSAMHHAVQNTGGPIYFGVDSSTASFFGTGNYAGVLYTTSTGGLSITAANADLRFYTGAAALRWGINNAGDWTFGASSHIADSSGTPTCSSGGCTGAGSVMAGADYSMTITTSNAASTSLVVNFGHTFSSTPVCQATQRALAPATTALFVNGISTTQLTLAYASQSNAIIDIHCRSY